MYKNIVSWTLLRIPVVSLCALLALPAFAAADTSGAPGFLGRVWEVVADWLPGGGASFEGTGSSPASGLRTVEADTSPRIDPVGQSEEQQFVDQGAGYHASQTPRAVPAPDTASADFSRP